MPIVVAPLPPSLPMPTVVAPLPSSSPTVSPSVAGSKNPTGSSAMVVGSALRPADPLHPDGASPRSGSSRLADSLRYSGTGTGSSRITSGTPAIIEEEESPLPAQSADVTQPADVVHPAEATPVLPAVHHVMSLRGTEDTEEASYVPFSVTPASGQIAAGASAEILVKFSPLDVSEYFACLTARYSTYIYTCKVK